MARFDGTVSILSDMKRFRSPFFMAVVLFSAWTAFSIGAENSAEKQRKNLEDRIDAILGADDFDDPSDIVDADPEKLKAAVELLRESEPLFPRSDPAGRDRYISWRLTLTDLFASKIDKAETDALLEELLVLVASHSHKELRDFFTQQIRDRQKYGFIDFGMIRTVDEALKIEKPEWRDFLLSSVAQKAARGDAETPPDFAEALRAAKAISDDDRGNRDLCLGIIAVRQARAGLFDDAEKTLTLLEEIDYGKLGCILAFAPLYEQKGDPAAAKQKIDAGFELTLLKPELSMAFNPQFFFCCCDLMRRLKTPELKRYLFDKMLQRQERYEKESPNDRNRRTENFLALATAVAQFGDRVAAKNYCREAETLLVEREKTSPLAFTDRERQKLIATILDIGFQEEGRKMLDEHLTRILASEASSPQSISPSVSQSLYWFMQTLCGYRLYAEAFAVTVKIPEKKQRFEAYDWFEVSIRFHLDEPPLAVMIHPSRIPFESAGEIQAVADLLANGPDGTELERLCGKIRRHAERFDKKKE